MSSISSSLEDYLEAIAELSETQEHAHTKDIACKLHVTMPSVTNALQSLSSRGLIVYHSHEPVTLTTAGAQRAAVIRNRHVAMRHFFSDVLKLDPTEANETACKLEHIIDEKVMSRFVCLASAISTREDCTSLRRYLEQVMPQLHSDDDDVLIPLSELPTGKRAVVGHMDETLHDIDVLAAMGIAQGALLQMDTHNTHDDSYQVKVLCSSIVIHAKDAALIWVKPTEETP